MIKQIKIFLIAVFFLLISVPLLQTVRPFLPEPPLSGVLLEKTRPRFSWSTWFSGDFQKYFDQWFSDHLGLRAYFIKTDNQLNFSLFREISQKTNAPIVVGRQNNLYEQGYINDYEATSSSEVAKLEAEVKKIKQLQNLVEARNKRFIFLISPSKPVVYPEYLPDGDQQFSSDRLTNYKIFLNLLNKYQVNYFDGQAYLLNYKKLSPYVLFAKGGTHWNYLGACLASAQLLKGLDKAGQSWPQISCNRLNILQTPRKEDLDLASLINIWQEQIFYEPLPYPQPSLSNNSSYRPRLLIVGGSFIWNILRVMKEAKVIGNSDFYYYFSKDSQYPADTFLPIDRDSLNIERVLKEHDAVILESNGASLTEVGFGFVDLAISSLK